MSNENAAPTREELQQQVQKLQREKKMLEGDIQGLKSAESAFQGRIANLKYDVACLDRLDEVRRAAQEFLDFLDSMKLTESE